MLQRIRGGLQSPPGLKGDANMDGMTVATWVLAVATIGLLAATSVLALLTYQLARSSRDTVLFGMIQYPAYFRRGDGDLCMMAAHQLTARLSLSHKQRRDAKADLDKWRDAAG